jgi:hypothetical protein
LDEKEVFSNPGGEDVSVVSVLSPGQEGVVEGIIPEDGDSSDG